MSDLLSVLKRCADEGRGRALDYQFAHFLAEQGATESVVLAGYLASAELAEGHVCLSLDCPPVVDETLAPLLARFPLVSVVADDRVVGEGALPTPLVLDRGRLYLYRYWRYEVEVSRLLRQGASDLEVDEAALRASLDQLFGENAGETDWQKVAAAVAAQRRFSVISGGPGTGKTTTVTKLLALIVGLRASAGRAPLIRLAAPTGKAAARLSESIAGALARLNLPSDIAGAIPREASTLHRLLGSLPNSHNFRHNRDNPLHLDLLVVDEASMIDLPMMARLLEALPDTAQLILIGDRDQLASVEAGSVLGDICRGSGAVGYSPALSARLNRMCGLIAPEAEAHVDSPLMDSVAQLRKSYRFDEHSGIGHLARATNDGDSARFSAALNAAYGDIEYQTLSGESYDQLVNRAANGYGAYFRLIDDGASPQTVLAQFNELQLLCALRAGPYGVEGLNDAIRSRLAGQSWARTDGQWYSGRPVIITRNDPALELYNGDIGITMADDEGNLKVWFEQSGRVRPVLPSRLPAHETVYAMTVHKSQGSEFRQVLLLLPPGDKNPVVTRELLYTGITRARSSLTVCATNKALQQAIQNPTERRGGLAERLWDIERV